MICEREVRGGGVGYLDLVAGNGAFVLRHAAMHASDRSPGVGRSVLSSWPSRFARRSTHKTLDRAPDFLEIKSTEQPSEPVSPSVNQPRNPLCKPVLSSRPRSLGPRPSLSSPHSSAHDSKSAATSIHPTYDGTTIRPGKEGSRAAPASQSTSSVTPPTVAS